MFKSDSSNPLLRLLESTFDMRDPFNSQPPFWLVYGDGQKAPQFKHYSHLSAATEAQRLATLHPGIKFYIAKPVSFAHLEKPEASFTIL